MTETAPQIDPERAMLLVMDYQPAILDRLPGAGELLQRLAGALDVARRAGVAVGYVRVAFDDADYDAVPDTNKGLAAMATARRLPSDAPETAVHSAVAPRPSDLVVRKTRLGAFSTTALDRRLRERGIDTLILAGISTSGVVLSTVRDAADRDYRLYVLADACADRDPDMHALLMQKLFPRQAWVVAIADLPGLLGVA